MKLPIGYSLAWWATQLGVWGLVLAFDAIGLVMLERLYNNAWGWPFALLSSVLVLYAFSVSFAIYIIGASNVRPR